MVLYMNLRPADVSNSFPLRNEVPTRILTEKLNTTTVDYEIRCCVFFAAIFNALQEDLSMFLERGVDDFDKAVHLWNTDMHIDSSEARHKFFERVRSKFEKVCKGRDIEKCVDDVVTSFVPLPSPRMLVNAYFETGFDQQLIPLQDQLRITRVRHPISLLPINKPPRNM